MLTIATSWWAIALRGVLAILFAIAAVLWPGLTLLVLVLLFGAYALVDGIFAVVAGIRTDRSDLRWPLIIEGIVGVIAGGAALILPDVAALALVFVIAAWAIVTGIFETIAAIRLRTVIENEWALALTGVLSVVFGVLMALQPAAGALALIVIIAAYALLFGILMLFLAFRLRSQQERLRQNLSARPA